VVKNILSMEELIISFVFEVKNLFINLTFVTQEKKKSLVKTIREEKSSQEQFD